MKRLPASNLFIGALLIFLAAVYFEKAWFAYHHGGFALDEAGDAGWLFTWQAFALATVCLAAGLYAVVSTIVRGLKR
jgi:hypothetical protein